MSRYLLVAGFFGYVAALALAMRCDAGAEIVILPVLGSVLAFGATLARWRAQARGFEALGLVLQALGAVLLGFVVFGVAVAINIARCGLF